MNGELEGVSQNTIREFLTIEEVKQLMATPCRYDIVKRAFLFSCFTGLRYSDIKSLLWSEIRKAADGRTLFLEHPQVKTRKIVTVPLSFTFAPGITKVKVG